MKIKLQVLIFCAGLVVAAGSCKKGCTNKHAFNYDATAKVEDASCVFCDSINVNDASTQTWVSDNDFNSPFYGTNVLTFSTTMQVRNYSGNACAALGYKSGCSTGVTQANIGYVQTVATNLTSDTIGYTGRYQLTVFTGITNETIDTFFTFKVAPGQPCPLPLYYFSCLQTNFASSNANFFSYQIFYP